jgi:hypothetical protein
MSKHVLMYLQETRFGTHLNVIRITIFSYVSKKVLKITFQLHIRPSIRK